MNMALSCRAGLALGLSEPGGLGLLRKRSTKAGKRPGGQSGLERAAHHLALRSGIFMGVWMAGVGTRKRLVSSCTTGLQPGLHSYFTSLFAVA